MRLGVSHVHHPGNELTLASLRSVYHSAAAPHTQKHSPCLNTNIPLIRPINQSINHAALTCATCTPSSLSSVGVMIGICFLDLQQLFFFFNRRTKMMSNFSILNHTYKVASNFMPCCLFLRPTSRRVNLINHQKHIMQSCPANHKQQAN